MSEQPPVQPPNPPNPPARGEPPTQPMPGSLNAPPAGATAPPGASADPPGTNRWHQVTSTPRRRWALGISAAAIALLLMLGIGVTGLLALGHHDRVGLLGNRQDGRSLQDGRGDSRRDGDNRGPGANNRSDRRDLRGDARPRAQGLGGLGNLLGGTALHGTVTATVNGSVQALVFQRGEVTAVSETSITLKSSDGFVGTYGRTGETRSRGQALATGGQAFVVARAADKVAVTTVALPAGAGVRPSSSPSVRPS